MDVYSVCVVGYVTERYLNIFKPTPENTHNNLPDRFDTGLGLFKFNQSIQELNNDYFSSLGKIFW